jgi:hypothetical protein
LPYRHAIAHTERYTYTEYHPNPPAFTHAA